MTNAIDIKAAAAKAVKATDSDSLAALFDRANDALKAADRSAIETTALAWIDMGHVVAGALTLSKAADLHTSSQPACDAALSNLLERSLPKGTARRYLRASLYVTPDLLRKAVDSLGTPEGPKSGRITDVITWCQAHDADHWKSTGSNANGGEPASRADAIKRASRKAADKAAETRKAAAADAARKAADEAAALAASVDEAAGRVKFGLVTAASLKAADDAAIRATIDACTAVLAEREAAAKAAKAAADEAAKAASKAAAADVAASRKALVAAIKAMDADSLAALLSEAS